MSSNARHSIQYSSHRVSAHKGTHMRQQRVAVENSPSPQSIVHTYTTIIKPLQSTLSILHPPCHALYFRPLSLRTRRPSQSPAEQILLHTSVLVSRRSRHHKIRKKHAMCLSLSLIQIRANERCDSYKAHVSSPARQSRFCRRSQQRHPLYQPYRVCRRGPILFSSVDGGWRWVHAYV